MRAFSQTRTRARPSASRTNIPWALVRRSLKHPCEQARGSSSSSTSTRSWRRTSRPSSCPPPTAATTLRAQTSIPRNVACVQFAFDLMYVLSARRCANTLCCSNSTRDGPNPPCHGDCSLAMLQWAKFSYDWARDDHRIVVRPPHAFESESCSDRDRIAERVGTEPMGECSNGWLGLSLLPTLTVGRCFACCEQHWESGSPGRFEPGMPKLPKVLDACKSGHPTAICHLMSAQSTPLSLNVCAMFADRG